MLHSPAGGAVGLGFARLLGLSTMATGSEGTFALRQSRRRMRGSWRLPARSGAVVVGVAGCLLLLRLGPALAIPAKGPGDPPQRSSLRREERELPPLSALEWSEWTREWGQMVRELRDAYREGQEEEKEAQAQAEEEATVAGRVGVGVGVGVDVGGHIESMRSPVAEAINSMSETPDRFFPVCAFVSAFDRLQLTCPVVAISAQLLIRGPPEFDRVTKEYPFPADPGMLTWRETNARVLCIPLSMIKSNVSYPIDSSTQRAYATPSRWRI